MIDLRVIGLVLVWTVAISSAQPLDWTTDMTIFGTTDDEQAPSLTALQNGNILRAQCVKSSGNLSSRVSVDFGSTWSEYADLPVTQSQPRLSSSSAGNFSFSLVYGRGSSQRSLRRFAAANNDWNSTPSVAISPLRTTPVFSAAIYSDNTVQFDAPTVNVCWTEYTVIGGIHQAWFTQSIDSGVTFGPERTVFSLTNQSISSAEIALIMSGSSDAPKIVLAAPVDRAGTVPAAITVYHSENQGQTWSQGYAVDPVLFAQDEPDMIARGDTLLLTYTRRVSLSGKRDICMTYSLDGGMTFAPPVVVFAGSHDERTPRLSFMTDPGRFGVFFLSDSMSGDGGAVFLCEGSLLFPWILSDTLRISGDDHVAFTGGLSVVSTSNGVAACWSSRFPTGDLDIRFDASWRGTGISAVPASHPDQFCLGSCYPNPFNSTTSLPITVRNDGPLSLTITDMLGRQVWYLNQTMMAAGSHTIQLDLREHSSGVYWARVKSNSGILSTKLVLIK